MAGAGVNAADTARKSIRPAKILAGGTKNLVNIAGLGPKVNTSVIKAKQQMRQGLEFLHLREHLQRQVLELSKQILKS